MRPTGEPSHSRHGPIGWPMGGTKRQLRSYTEERLIGTRRAREDGPSAKKILPRDRITHARLSVLKHLGRARNNQQVSRRQYNGARPLSCLGNQPPAASETKTAQYEFSGCKSPPERDSHSRQYHSRHRGQSLLNHALTKSPARREM